MRFSGSIFLALAIAFCLVSCGGESDLERRIYFLLVRECPKSHISAKEFVKYIQETGDMPEESEKIRQKCKDFEKWQTMRDARKIKELMKERKNRD